MKFGIEIAEVSFCVEALFESIRDYCKDYWTDEAPMYRILVETEDLKREQMLLDMEADDEGLKRRKFSDMFLERSVIQRRVARCLLERNVLLMHGSTVSVDGEAYLFTAACGTGKSTHTRLWREVFGQRAVMVNDDKPFLKVTDDGVLAYGSPWTGKHGLGSNVCVPLGGICILNRGADNVISRVDPKDFADFLRHQIQPEEDERAGVLLDEVLRRVPVWAMACNKEPDAARISHRAMSGNHGQM